MIAREIRDKVRYLIDSGLTQKEIAAKENISIATINRVSRMSPEKFNYEVKGKDEKYVWLKQNWQWSGTVSSRRYRGHYRIVHKGDLGIRTMYKPDGIFR